MERSGQQYDAQLRTQKTPTSSNDVDGADKTRAHVTVLYTGGLRHHNGEEEFRHTLIRFTVNDTSTEHRVHTIEYRLQDIRYRVQAAGCRVQGAGCREQ